jgi:hypothetical protein
MVALKDDTVRVRSPLKRDCPLRSPKDRRRRKKTDNVKGYVRRRGVDLARANLAIAMSLDGFGNRAMTCVRVTAQPKVKTHSVVDEITWSGRATSCWSCRLPLPTRTTTKDDAVSDGSSLQVCTLYCSSRGVTDVFLANACSHQTPKHHPRAGDPCRTSRSSRHDDELSGLYGKEMTIREIRFNEVMAICRPDQSNERRRARRGGQTGRRYGYWLLATATDGTGQRTLRRRQVRR